MKRVFDRRKTVKWDVDDIIENLINEMTDYYYKKRELARNGHKF